MRGSSAVADRDFEVSGMHVASMVKAIAAQKRLDEVLAKVGPVTREAVKSPHSQKWHPSVVLVELSDALRAVAGSAGFELANYTMARESFGPIVAPMLKVALALSGSTPATLFSRLDDSLQLTMRGVHATWTSSDPKSGVVRVNYPRAVPAEVRLAFDGVFRFVFELAGAKGRIDGFEHLDEGRTLALKVSWS